MKRSIIKRLTATFVLAVTLCMVLFMTSYAEESVVFSAVELQENYTIGDVLEIPTVTASVGEQTYKTQSTLFRPDGIATSSTKETLSIPGKYILRYSAFVGAKEYRSEHTFIVNAPLFETEKKSATATYNAELGAIALTMDNKTKFLYNGIIDLTDNDTSSPLIELYNVADVTGEKNFGQVMIVLTDLEDEKNTVYIRINESDGFGQYEYPNYTSYASVSLGGTNSFRGKDGTRLHINNQYGTPVRFSYCNLGVNGATPENDRVQVYWDYNEKQVLIYSSSAPSYGGVVVDFDSTDCYKDFWEGFSNGKCRLSVYATSMYKTDAKIFITNIDGHDLSLETTVDTKAPELIVDAPETITKGIVGYNYPVFSYTTRDDNGVKTSTVNVYYNYHSDHPASITIKDGTVKPPYAGKYTLVYRSEDFYGNVAEKIIDFSVDSVGVASPLTIDVSGEYSDCLAGEIIPVISSTVSYSPVYGSVTEKVVASCNGSSFDITGLDSFMPTIVGEWTITYLVTDTLGRTSGCSKQFVASVNSTPVFLDEDFSMLPAYFVSGTTYKLPARNATLFGTQVSEIPAQIKYNIDGTVKNVEGEEFTPVIDDRSSDVTIIYYVDGAELSVTRSVVNPYEGTTLDLVRLFPVIGGSADISSGDKGVSFLATTDFAADYLNQIIYSKLQIGMNIKSASDVMFTLTDAENANRQMTLSFSGENGKYDMYINGVRTDSVARSSISIKFNGSSVTVNSSTYSIKKYLDGSDFTGFESGRVYVRVSMTEGSSIDLDRIGNQALLNATGDFIDPMLWVDENIDLYVSLNAVITLPEAFAYDAISGICPVTVTARLNGKYLMTDDGREIKDIPYEPGIEVALSQYGNCFITYKTVDAADNPFTVSLAVYIVDDVKPELEVATTIPGVAYVGDTIKVEGVVATDNYSFDVVSCVMTIDPALAYDTSKDGSVTFDRAGKWTIRCFAYDESGNLGYVDYTVVVKEAN